MNVLGVDIGGTHIKFRTQRQTDVMKIKSGSKMTPQRMMAKILDVAKDWEFDRVSLGFPGPVVHDRPLREPFNLGKGWKEFRFGDAFQGRPVRMINDAAMQALGSYEGGRMLFLGLGTGLGSAMVVDGVVQAMELAHLPWAKGHTYEDYLGAHGLKHYGHKKWTKALFKVIDSLQAALEADYVVLGGGNAKEVESLPAHVRLGANDNAFKGAFMLWQKAHAASR